MDINEFRSNFTGGGARSSLFRITITNPVDSSADAKLQFLATATALPEYVISVLEVPYMGRRIRLAGKKDYGPFNVTILNDEDFALRNAMESWSNAINSPEGNVRTLGGSSPTLYKSLATVEQLSQTNSVLRTYTMVGIWPSQISAIDLNWGDEAVESFQVSFALDYFYVESGSTGDAGGV